MNTFVDLGIDLSLLHTAINIEYNNKIYYYSIDRGNYSKKHQKLIEELQQLKNYKYYKIETPKNINEYSLNEINKIKSMYIIINKILDILNNYKINKIGIEGISYSSCGLKSLDIVGLHFLLRKELMQITENIQIIAPKTAKKIAGNGNAKKIDMLNFYLNSNRDPNLENCKIRKFIRENLKLIVNKDNVREPICGMIDSYFVRKSINV